ncbi:type II toxin-antitoxin system ParD family antitoxin [Crocinitomix catalasitica]|uniref:type II toxin-antitoxin system ParD family antitoxin n=1 Tax=Crocinitomix catalasitica TaxID=184607 RepID=UPI0004804361|nr:type II toxin-antitoxin system ParD family antitoxin [Crocinitomix catalasitica]
MNKNTSVSLGNYFDEFVQGRVNEGRFKNVSEVIRAGLRLLEEEENKVVALKNAIQQGIDSGIAHDFDPKKHLASLKAKKHSNGAV